ncbi:MAG: ABC transporter ATP-binding protein [Lachnospiraceae bacterium]|nr:ABC transporter ATP-binding protein [Lachnospiraceae bacterium]
MEQNAVEITNLCKEYPGFLLDHVSFQVPDGCIVGLVGKNGAGKSTTLRLLLNLLKADAGKVKVFGQDMKAANPQIFEDIGVVLDRVGLPMTLNAVQIGKVMAEAYTQWDARQYEAYLRQFEIPTNKKFMDLSNGTQMKLGLAIAFSHKAKLLVLDEATNGLDPVVRDQVNEILMDFTREEHHSVLISSHIVSDLEKLCDYIAFLHEGKLSLFEEKDVLANEYLLVHGRSEQIDAIPAEAVLKRRETGYGTEAVVRRESVPADLSGERVGIEELFVIMEDKTR